MLVKVFLRHAKTGHYYIGNSEWVLQASDARDLESIEAAVDLAAADKLDGMVVVVHYPDGEHVFDLSQGLPLRKASHRVDSPEHDAGL